jgi:hypothetical protein
VGLWVATRRLLWDGTEEAMPEPGRGQPPPFRFDGGAVHLRVYWFRRPGPPEWEDPEDSIYRLKAGWVGSDLYHLHTNGEWWKDGTFTGGRFVVIDPDRPVRWVMERQDGAQHSDYLRPFLKDRPLWHYPPLTRGR